MVTLTVTFAFGLLYDRDVAIPVFWARLLFQMLESSF